MTDDRAETHVIVDDPDNPGTDIALHFQEWWIRYRASLPARRFVIVGIEEATPAPGVVDALRNADVIVLPPSNPIVSIGTILAVPGLADEIRAAKAPVVGVSPIISGAPVRGMADACLRATGIETSAAAVAQHYGARPVRLLDGWLVDTSDAASTPVIEEAVSSLKVPLLMTDLDATAAMAAETLDLASRLRSTH